MQRNIDSVIIEVLAPIERQWRTWRDFLQQRIDDQGDFGYADDFTRFLDTQQFLQHLAVLAQNTLCQALELFRDECSDRLLGRALVADPRAAPTPPQIIAMLRNALEEAVPVAQAIFQDEMRRVFPGIAEKDIPRLEVDERIQDELNEIRGSITEAEQLYPKRRPIRLARMADMARNVAHVIKGLSGRNMSGNTAYEVAADSA